MNGNEGLTVRLKANGGSFRADTNTNAVGLVKVRGFWIVVVVSGYCSQPA